MRTANLTTKRFRELLVKLAVKGVNQAEVGRRIGTGSQFVSDLKHGRRIMNELVARRLGEEFGVDYEFLLGRTSTMAPPRVGNDVPVVSLLIEGDPRKHLRWDGSTLELFGPAAALVANSTFPYALRCPVDDRSGRIRQGDLVLISQSASTTAEISVVNNDGLWLARRPQAGRDWKRIDDNRAIPGASPAVGHCLAILWGLLLKDP
jgi:hypothetical protein